MSAKLIYAAALLMMLAILVLILVLMEGRKKSKRKNHNEVRVSPSVKSAPVKNVPQPVRQMAHQPVENRSSGHIYAYTPRNHVRRCPGCDGENPPSRSRCVICGCEMSPMGR